jgi:NAD(P)-dependent dehydrogenase (short-subunit alcohol dehydrogenase family)
MVTRQEDQARLEGGAVVSGDTTGRLAGRVALVTGASSGLGSRFAHVLARAGARVVLGARREAQLADVVAAISDDGGAAMAVAMDVTDEASVIAAYDAAQSRFGPVDTVIANAGMNVAGPALDIDADAIDAVMGVNVRGVFLTAREGARRMIAAGSPETGRGRIVIISSITATAISPGLGLYAASKAASLQLGRTLARDWVRKGINVNILCPGYIETDLNSDWFQTDGGRKQIGKWPRARLMGEAALDDAVAYLCSDDSAYVTGSVMTVDDGQSLAG